MVPATSLARKDPRLAAMVSKMETAREPMGHDQRGNLRASVTNTHLIRGMLSKRAKRNQDTSSIMKLLPDIELSVQILTSSILSPKDMTTLELIYDGPRHLLAPELSAAILARIKQHFEEGYDFKKIVPEMLREPMFEKGAYPIAVIPENVVDAVINQDRNLGMESMSRLSSVFRPDGVPYGIGLLGNPKAKTNAMNFGVSLEDRLSNSRRVSASQTQDNSNYYVTYKDTRIDGEEGADIEDWKDYVIEDCLAVTDNPSVLKVPMINEIMKQKAVHRAYNDGRYKPGMEAMGEEKINDFLVQKAIYRHRPVQSTVVSELPYQNEMKRSSVGSPLIMKLPSESVLPVHVPGNPKQHVGYFVLLDEEGNPLECPDGDHLQGGMQGSANNSLTSNLMKKAAINMGVNDDQFDPRNTMHVKEATRMYSEMIERDLISRVRNGVYTGNVTIARNEEVYRLMLSRVLSKRRSQLLYIPVEYMTYIAFKYGDDGVGRSLLDDHAMLYVIRSVLLFTDVLASVKNSIGRTRVSGQLDPKDPNPQKTIDMIQDEIVRSRMVEMPMSVSSPVEIHKFIQKAGYEWEFTGHAGIPDMKFEFASQSSDIRKSDTELMEYLRKSTIMGLGLSPETVDNGFNAEFATTALHNNVLLSKRVIAWQDEFTPQLTDHARKVILHTEDIKNDIKELLEASYDQINLTLEDSEKKQIGDETKQKKLVINRALHEFLRGFKISLPRPVSATLETQSDELNKYMDMVEKALDAYLSTDIFAESTMGDLSQSATTLKGMVKAYFIRKWMAQKNILPELSELTAVGSNNELLTDVCKEIIAYTQDVSRFGVGLFTQLKSNTNAVSKDLANAGIDLNSGGGFGGSSDSPSGSGDPFGGDGMGGFDDFGGDAGADPFAAVDDAAAGGEATLDTTGDSVTKNIDDNQADTQADNKTDGEESSGLSA